MEPVGPGAAADCLLTALVRAGVRSQSWSSGIRYMCQWHLRIFCGYDFGNFWVIVPEPPAAAAAADRTPTTTPTLSGRD